jgi:isopenicillin N synthase-like dioxygenase
MSVDKRFEGFADESEFIHTGLGNRKVASSTSATPSKITSVPIIDLADATSPSLEKRKAVAKEIFTACSQIGFFYIKNHGVDKLTTQAVQKEGLRLFQDISHEQKMTLAMAKNEKEYYGYAPMSTEMPTGAIKRRKFPVMSI